MSAPTPEQRAALATFIGAEVHALTDGNGRTSRLALNLFLTQAWLTRIIIKTVYRDDYILAWRPSRATRIPVPLVRMLTRAARFSPWLDVRSRDTAFAALRPSNALEQPTFAKLTFDEAEIGAAQSA